MFKPLLLPTILINNKRVTEEGNFQPGVGNNLTGRTVEMTLLATSPFSVGLTLVWEHHFYTWGMNWGQDILSMNLIFSIAEKDAVIQSFKGKDI